MQIEQHYLPSQASTSFILRSASFSINCSICYSNFLTPKRAPPSFPAAFATLWIAINLTIGRLLPLAKLFYAEAIAPALNAIAVKLKFKVPSFIVNGVSAANVISSAPPAAKVPKPERTAYPPA